MQKLNVYFINGLRAKLDPDKTVFHEAQGLGDVNGVLTSPGEAIVNWNAVAYVKLAEEEVDDD